MKYPMIERLGLSVGNNYYDDQSGHCVSADDLEKLLSEAKVLGSWGDKTCWFDRAQYFADKECDTHSALLIGIQPLRPKEVLVTIEQLAKVWDEKVSCANMAVIGKSDTSNRFQEFCDGLGL